MQHFCVANLLMKDRDSSDQERFHYSIKQVKIPAIITGQIPEVPFIIKYNDFYFVQDNTNPLTYREVSFGEAE
jgi:hypothetical protein